MIFKGKKIILKNGKAGIFKTPEPEDAEKMLDYIKTCCGETEFLARYPEEWDISEAGITDEKAWINSMRNSTSEVSIACFCDGIIVGHCALSFGKDIKVHHRASIAIAVRKTYWEQGIGSHMFEEMIKAAKDYGTEILELTFEEGNNRGKTLYEKFGFSVISERPNMFKLKDGTMLKEFYMQKVL